MLDSNLSWTNWKITSGNLRTLKNPHERRDPSSITLLWSHSSRSIGIIYITSKRSLSLSPWRKLSHRELIAIETTLYNALVQLCSLPCNSSQSTFRSLVGQLITRVETQGRIHSPNSLWETTISIHFSYWITSLLLHNVSYQNTSIL